MTDHLSKSFFWTFKGSTPKDPFYVGVPTPGLQLNNFTKLVLSNAIIKHTTRIVLVSKVIKHGTREKRSAHACLPCFRRIFAIEIIRDNKTN